MSTEDSIANRSASAEPEGEVDILAKMSDIGAEALELAEAFVQLMALEVALAFKNLPKVIGLAIFSMFLGATTWLSMCVLCAYGVFLLWQSVLMSIMVFCLLQVVGLIGCKIFIASLITQSTLPKTREFIRNMRD